MLISHRHRFIFLKTEKTASTSLYTALKSILEREDRLLPAVPKVRSALLHSYGSLEGFSFVGGLGSEKRRWAHHFGLHQHALAREVKAFIGEELFCDYLIISSERNPWDRQISLFSHRSGRADHDQLTRFTRCMSSPLHRLLHHTRLKNWEVYSVDDEVCADVVVRFEHLHRDYEALLSRLGLDAAEHPLPHRRNSGREDQSAYREFYNDHTRALVAQWYEREILHFGYTF